MSDYLQDFFSKETLMRIYFKKLYYSGAVGIDKINSRHFTNRLNNNIDKMIEKLSNNTYKFTSYKEILITKGRNKYPRVISVPTVRDRLVQQSLNEHLQEKYKDYRKFELSQTIISSLIYELDTQKYNYYLKIDLTNFCGTINHELLLSKLTELNINSSIIDLIYKSITTPTVNIHSLKGDRAQSNNLGVPQGLSISNVLASIYMLDLDCIFENRLGIHYIRYVDDILILCDSSEITDIKDLIKFQLVDNLKLAINTAKCDEGSLLKEFSFLGYAIKGKSLIPRDIAMQGLEKKLEKLFIDLIASKEKNYKLFVWRLNLKITGAISKGKKFGWLFYFSQITDIKVLFHLDWYITRLVKRFNLEDKLEILKIKKFVRAFNEITLNLNKTNYIPNFDEFDTFKMNNFLVDICNLPDNLSIDEIQYQFYRILYKSLSNLEKDLQTFS